MKLFVPGRICLFGEHSDWAGGYRRINAEIEKGYTIISGTNQGVYAEVEAHPTQLILSAALEDGTRKGPWEVPMKKEALLAEAEKGGFFSYAAGVAYQILIHYRARGLRIDNYRTDLPIKKGLSSSAAICVLVARAFNRVYDLKMTTRGEMEYAYQGEITTPSRCGRMDQGCAYGNRPVLMTFDGDRIEVKELDVPRDLHFVIVDLHAKKDTREILKQLNRCYPFADDEVQRSVQDYLGPVSAKITREAVEALESGNARRLGVMMREAQTEFDRHLKPACPAELTAPVLHRLLEYEPIQPYIFGGKGVGSQGDGTAQLVAKDEASQAQAIERIEKDLNMSCLKLTIGSGRKVKKAVITAAGFGTRLFPATKAIRKELFPVIDSTGRAVPAILTLVNEAVNSGIEQIAVIVQQADLHLFEEVFYSPPSVENYNKLSLEDQKYCGALEALGHRITFIPQAVQEGFGHAVYSVRDWVAGEPFLLMLGDHLYASETQTPCTRQVLDVYERARRNVVGLKVTPEPEIHHFGCVTGEWLEPDSLLSITQLYEKPNVAYAREHLHVEGMSSEEYLTLFGLYVLSPKIFEYLEEHIEHHLRERGEFQLTSCLDKLRQEEGFTGCLVRGRRFDIGEPDAYRQTVIDFRTAEGSSEP